MIRVAGVDGGGTRTRCLVADESGSVLGQGEAGPANCATLPLPEVAAAIAAALDAACRTAGCRLSDLDTACAGLAGFYPPWHASGLAQALEPHIPGALRVVEPHPSPSTSPTLIPKNPSSNSTLNTRHSTLLLFPDLVIAWAGGLALQPGVVLVAGTGSVAYGRNAAGEAARAGGWGYLAGDEGSAYWIGRAALAALARALDGRTDPTVLADSLPRRFPNGCAASEEWLRAIYRERWSPGQVAALAPVVSEAAEQGDTAAGAILAAAGQQLAGLAGHVLRKLRLAETDAGVVGAGGLLEVKGLVRDTVAADLRREAPRATLRPARLPPVAGAVLLALAHRGAAIGEDTVARMAG